MSDPDPSARGADGPNGGMGASNRRPPKSLTSNRLDRYPNIKSTEVQGVTSLEMNIPRGAGGGQLQQQTGNVLQRMVAGQLDGKEGLTQIENEWQRTLSADDYTVDEESVGFNKPEPGYDWA